MTTLYLLADSNLFLHYRSLHEIDWSVLGGFDQIEIIVCRTVQREIDSLKDGREGRRSERARKTASAFLEIARSGPQEQRRASPRVLLKLYGDPRPKQDLADRLDYSQNDDRIIGHLAQFREDNPEVDARLLTRDSGPVLTATTLGLPYEVIPDSWLLPPESDDRDKKIAALNQQLAELQAQEPQFQINCERQETDRSGHLAVSYIAFRPLEPAEQEQVLHRLGITYPPTVRRRVGVSASAIRDYEERDHPRWLAKCQELMPEVHAILKNQHFPEITFAIQNTGSRPATNARIDIQAVGNFGLTSPTSRLARSRLLPSKRRPSPPEQPQPTIYDIAAMLKNISDPGFLATSAYPLPLPQHDKEGFYYSDPVDITPERSISLICDLWRHASEPEEFSVRIVPLTTDRDITGELTCTVHADNLAKPATCKLVVTLSPDHHSTLPRAIEWFTTSHLDESED